MTSLVLGTAGHIDHGKTSLVRALTGVDTDRLPVEKARGITTELGFAKLVLGDQTLAVVDVPGHERFVKSMVAGATGLDLVALVIAADEGVMPQTREHLEICELLAVRRGIVVLTKSDLVDEEWLELVTSELPLAGTFLEHAPIIPVSTKTGAGLDALRAALAKLAAELPPRTTTGVFRLPIDRIFTIKGFGTVVTGTILGGSVAIGDELLVIPSELSARVRGLEVHGAACEHASAGMRVAINLGNVAVDDLARGDLLCRAGQVAASHIIDVELRALAAMPARSKVLVHHGTAQVSATLALVGATTLEAGATGLAQLRIDASTPLGALPGDRFILRGTVANAMHGSTIGGGRVIRVLAPRARRGPRHAEIVAGLAAARSDQRIALDVKNAAFAGLTTADLVRRIGLPAEVLPLDRLVASGELLHAGEHYLHATAVAELEMRITAAAANEPQREELRTQLPAALPARVYDLILAGLVKKGAIVATGDRVAKAAPRLMLSPIEARLLALFAQWQLEPLRPKELSAALGTTEPLAKAALDKLIALKLVARVKPDLMIHADALAALRTKLLAFLDAHGTIDAQQWKDLTGASRKFTIPIAEYFDAEKVTLRVGDARRRR